jgi:hypothetical protein
LEERAPPSALTVSAKQAIAVGWQQRQAREGVATAPASAWERHRGGAGSKGPRLYDWLRLPITHP